MPGTYLEDILRQFPKVLTFPPCARSCSSSPLFSPAPLVRKSSFTKAPAPAASPTTSPNLAERPACTHIVDLSTHDSYPIFYFTLNGQRQSRGSFPLNPTYYNAAPGFNGKTIGVFNFLFDSGSVTNFATLFFHFRGKAVTVPVSSTSNGVFPETLTGIFRGISHNNGNPFNNEINFVLNYDSLRTKAANNLFKSGATVYSDILAELSAKGYQ